MWTIRIAFSVFAFVALYLIFTANLPSNAGAPTGIHSPASANPANSNQYPLPQVESESPFQQTPESDVCESEHSGKRETRGNRQFSISGIRLRKRNPAVTRISNSRKTVPI